ncbi:uncharacterized protein ARB_02188 [Trichophyton benhamiae CBS 112371]|uniref:LysM domain-containing protein n=1 Tax=Arthroderma benhamiae (strain ATCC MYA-4681 / CBS 112371) TaxID=663331 RepID=D4B159_ARTBC|nr:uncharacterized protein ARB_02188 [Trichophyton benhamiae CBS 112371]EFE30994.1 hypothetical protein ARB_02188 [Trichophyton benhamiae CBS 112371]
MTCLDFILLLWVCVAVGGQAVSQTASAQKPSIPGETMPAGPTKPRTARNCNRWHIVEKGDTCPKVESIYGISHNQFLEWNPSVPKDCSREFWLGYSYCVGVNDNPVIATPIQTNLINSTMTFPSTSPTSVYSIRNPVTSDEFTVSSVETAWPPKRTQPGQPSYCNKWYHVKIGDTCNTIQILHGTSMTLEEL